MFQEYFQNSVQLLANELKRYVNTSWLLWKLEKPFVLFVTSKTQTERFVGKSQIDNLGLFLVENKDWTKAENG